MHAAKQTQSYFASVMFSLKRETLANQYICGCSDLAGPDNMVVAAQRKAVDQ